MRLSQISSNLSPSLTSTPVADPLSHRGQAAGLRRAYRLTGEIGDRKCSFQLATPTLTVGSHRDNDLVLPVSGISRRHAVLRITDGQVTVEDRGSKNGTWINGRRIGRAQLAKGDELSLGGVILRLETSHPEDARLALSFDGPSLPADDSSWAGLRDSRDTEMVSRAAGSSAGPSPRAPRLNFPDGHVVGRSTGIQRLYRDMEAVAGGRYPILILGETGSGKEMISRTLHRSSPRRELPFVTVNCAAIPADLIEAEMFGVAKGAATGVEARPGCFARADGGTLFLDEVGELHPDLQAKLLRALEYGEVQPVGGKVMQMDVRVISATNVDLERQIADGRFRADLYYRLAASVVQAPPLRHRREDLPLLIQHFVERFADELDLRVRGVTQRALDLLVQYPWPGNVRELIHELLQAVQKIASYQALDSSLLSDKVRRHNQNEPSRDEPNQDEPSPELRAATDPVEPPSAESPRASGEHEPLPHLILKQHVAEVEKRIVAMALERADGNRTLAAQLLQISRNTLATKMALYGLAKDGTDH